MDGAISRCALAEEDAAALRTVAMTGKGAFTQGLEGATVYFTRDISSGGLTKIYRHLLQGRSLPGRVAVKLHSGEPGGQNYPAPALIKDLVQSVSGTIVECNTAYAGKRFNTADHMVALREHGFTDIAPVDIMDEDGSISLPFARGKHITENYVGAHFANYDSFVILSHFKGHAMAGFGGAIKNVAIGIASAEGKMWIHTGGETRALGRFILCYKVKKELFLESMAEAAGSVVEKLGTDRIVYVSLMNNLSIDCDCNKNPAPAELDDIGVLASFDPVALDRACVDLIYAADSEKSASLRERMESRNGVHVLDHAESLGIGRQQYTLVGIDA